MIGSGLTAGAVRPDSLNRAYGRRRAATSLSLNENNYYLLLSRFYDTIIDEY